VWDNTTVIHNTSHYKKRLIQEAIGITHNKDNFNREDAYPLSQSWKTTLVNKKYKGKKIKLKFTKKYSPESKADPENPGTGQQDPGIPRGINPGRTPEYLPRSSNI
jgi:hypothetical protein